VAKEHTLPEVFPTWLVVWWWIAFCSVAPFFFRMLYEQTFLTWARGPQALGFTMAHQFAGVLLLGIVGDFGMVIWLCLAFGYVVQRRRLPQGRQLAYLAVTLLGVAIAFVPYSAWAALGGVSLT
jgi:hypothetical protein